MKKNLLLFLAIFTFYKSQAQSDYRPGYIVTLQNDTVRGLVNYRKPALNFAECLYKVGLSEKPVAYKAGDIKGYGFDEGIHYRSFFLKETSRILSKKRVQPKYYFLNVLVSGKADLYFVRDIAKQDRFFVKWDSVFKELEVKEFTQFGPDGRIYKGKTKLYVGTLTYLLNDCPTLQPVINETKLTHSSLTGTLKAYNQCLHPDSLKFVQTSMKSKVTLGFTFGLNHSAIDFTMPAKTSQMVSQDFVSPGFNAGLTVNLSIPLISNNLSFQTDVLFFQNRFKASRKFKLPYFYGDPVFNPGGDLVRYHLNADVTLYSLKVPLQLRYFINYKKIQPYINGGIVYSYDLAVKEKGFLDTYFQGQQYRYPLGGYGKQGLYPGVTGGAGVMVRLPKGKSTFIDFKYLPENIRYLYGFESRVRTFVINTGLTF